MNRRGFSLVEVMIALVILTTGILAMAGTTGAVTRMIAQGGRMGGSAVVAEDQMEMVRATICTTLPGGTTAGSATFVLTSGRYSVNYVVTRDGWLRRVRMNVSYPNGRATRTDVYESAVSCAT